MNTKHFLFLSVAAVALVAGCGGSEGSTIQSPWDGGAGNAGDALVANSDGGLPRNDGGSSSGSAQEAGSTSGSSGAGNLPQGGSGASGGSSGASGATGAGGSSGASGVVATSGSSGAGGTSGTLGSSGSSGASGNAPPIPSTRTLSSLSDNERRQLCTDTGAFLDSKLNTNKLACAETVATNHAGAGQECDQAIRTCMASGQTGEPPSSQLGCNDPTGANIADCTATVGELNNCMVDIVGSFNLFIDEVATQVCSPTAGGLDAGADGGVDGGGMTTPASCEQLQAKCPGFASQP